MWSSLFALVVTVSIVSSQDCAFIPGPITESNDTAIIEVDCQGQPAADAGLSANTGDITHLVVYLHNCVNVSRDLFVGAAASLLTVVLLSEDSRRMFNGTFEGLENILELRLEGFQNLRTLSRYAFRPLVSLERLVLIGFGANSLSYAELGAALSGLSGTPLRRLVMHRIHSDRNSELTLNIDVLFRIKNVTVQELTVSDNFITSVTGRISSMMPHLRYICLGASARYYAAMNALLDAWLFLENLHEIVVYAYPTPDTRNTQGTGGVINTNALDTDIKVFLGLYSFRENCASGLSLPLTSSLRRVTMINLQFLDADIDMPICFEPSNNVEYLDFRGSPLPYNMTPVTGLRKLQHLDIGETGIAQLHDEFLRYFPTLVSVDLGQLALGPWLTTIDSHFFGSCPTLRHINMGECRLTDIPPSTFLFLPFLETLNLSSNSLPTFHVNLENSRNLKHLNLSDNDISSLSQDVIDNLSAIAQRRLEDNERLTVDLRRNPLSCLCNATDFVRQVQDWAERPEMEVAGFEEYRCLYPNNSRLEMSGVDVDQLVTQCSVIDEIQNGSNCPCDDDLRRRLDLVAVSLEGYFCINADGKMMSMTVQPLPSCPDFIRSATFIAPVVIASVLALFLCIVSVVIYRYRKNARVSRVIERLSMSRIVRIGIQYVMERNRDDPIVFNYDMFLYIQDDDQPAAAIWFDREVLPYRQVIRQDDFQVGLKLDSLLKNVLRCRWLVPILSQNFIDDGESMDFIARAQYSRPHAIVPVVWSPFHTDDLSIRSLLDNAEPVTWPGDHAPDAHKTAFWETLLHRTTATPGIA